MSKFIFDHRGGPDRIQFKGFPASREPLLPPPDCRWSVAGHIQGRAFSDKFIFNGKSDDTKYWIQRYPGSIKQGDVMITHVYPMLSPQMGVVLRIRCGCKGMKLTVKAYPIKCNENMDPPFYPDAANAVELIPVTDMDVAGESYVAWQPTNTGQMALQNYAIGIEFTELPEQGIWGNCCKPGCCPQFELVALGMDVCFTDSFSGDCTGRCADAWCPPDRCATEPVCGEPGCVGHILGDPPVCGTGALAVGECVSEVTPAETGGKDCPEGEGEGEPEPEPEPKVENPDDGKAATTEEEKAADENAAE